VSTGLFGRQSDLLRRERPFRLLFLATLGSGLGTGVAVIALTVDVFDRTGSGVWVAALLVADFLPMLAIGLLLGPLVDRFSRRRVMIASDLVRFGVFGALLFAPNEIVIVVLAGVAGFATGFFRPAVYAGMPNLVSERDLPHANALFQSVENLTWLVGPLLGGVMLTVSGPDVPYTVNAVSFLLSAGFVAAVPERLLQAGRAESEGHIKDLVAGFALVRRSRALLAVLIVWTIVMFGNAGINVAEVVFVKVSLDAGNAGLGLLMACAGLGLMLGSLAAGGLLERRVVSEVYGGAIGLMAIGFAAAALSPTIWLAAACVVLSGFGNGVASVCNPYLVQQGAPDELRGRAFTVIMSVNASALGVGMAIAGPFVDIAGARWVWGTAAGLYAVAALFGLVLARGVREAEPKEVPAVEPGPVAAADPAFGPTQIPSGRAEPSPAEFSRQGDAHPDE
jgi:MFS family permease